MDLRSGRWNGGKPNLVATAVRDQLKNVQHIQASDFAFAAILGDGSVVSWGGVVFGVTGSAARSVADVSYEK